MQHSHSQCTVFHILKHTYSSIGTPLPTVTWEKDNVAIDTTNEEFASIQINEHQLKISNVKESDIAEYSCIARNSEGSITAISKVGVTSSSS